MMAKRRSVDQAGPITYVVLIMIALVSLFPLYWTFVASSVTGSAVVQSPPPVLPGGNLFKNIAYVWNNAGESGMGVALLNSTIVAGSIALSTVVFSLFAGFAFAKLKFKGRGALLALVIAILAVPPQLSVVPLFVVMRKLHLTNQLPSVILPTLVTAFGVFFIRQYLSQALPDELIEAARMDGANSIRVVWHIVLPIARPALAVLGMLKFVESWNDFLWPIIALSGSNPTVQVALKGLGNGYTTDWSQIMAGALIGTLPLLIVFVFFSKHIVSGIAQGAVKG
jgi:cellobiose transport system permease protein